MEHLLQERAEELDEGDELRGFRGEFVLPDGVVYLDGNSLGAPSRRVLAALHALEDEWSRDLVTGWDRWLSLPTHVGDQLGARLLGAAEGQVIVTDSTTINLFKAIAGALSLRPDRGVVAIEPDIFPTDRYIAQRLAPHTRVFDGTVGDDVAVLVVSAVDYRTAAKADIETITAQAHDAGALVVWDLSHAVGALPLALDACGVDFAVGCTYKYVNAGPGAPAFLYVNRALQRDADQPIPGWFGHVDQFAMEAGYRPASTMARFLTGTPNIPGTVAVQAGVELLADAGLGRLAAKSRSLTAFAIECADALPAASAVTVATPRDPARRGSHVALRHERATDICAALIADHRVIPDMRPPDVIRLGFAPLYTRFVDVWHAFVALECVIEALP